MSPDSHADQRSLATRPQEFQTSQSAQLSQNNNCQVFPSGLENAQNGRKFGQVLPPQEGGAAADDSAQESRPYRLSSREEDEEDAIAKAHLKQYSDTMAQRAADNSAGKKGTIAPVPYPQVVIPATGRILERRSVGRPTVVNDDLREKVVLLLGGGASLTQAAALVGVARSTIAAALARDEDFAGEVHEARQRAAMFPLNCLLREATRNWRAAAWLLSYLDRKSEQERSRRERVLGAAQQEIEQDLVQELRERARRKRRRADDDGELADELQRVCRQRPPALPRLAAKPALPCQFGADPLIAAGETSSPAIRGKANG